MGAHCNTCAGAEPTTHVAHVPAAMIPTDAPVVDVMVTHWKDGAVEVAFRPGPGATWTTWGAPVEAVPS